MRTHRYVLRKRRFKQQCATNSAHVAIYIFRFFGTGFELHRSRATHPPSSRHWGVVCVLGRPETMGHSGTKLGPIIGDGPKLGPIMGPWGPKLGHITRLWEAQAWAHHGPWEAQAWAHHGT
jgi:hypothetical protein